MAEQPAFVHLVVYHAKPEHVSEVLASMQDVAQAASGSPGLLHIGPWQDLRTGAVVGLSAWSSQEAFAAAMPAIFAAVEDPDPEGTWEAAPPEVYPARPSPGGLMFLAAKRDPAITFEYVKEP